MHKRPAAWSFLALLTLLTTWGCADDRVPGSYPGADAIGPPDGAATHEPGTGDWIPSNHSPQLQGIEQAQGFFEGGDPFLCDDNSQSIRRGLADLDEVVVMSERFETSSSDLGGYFVAAEPPGPYGGIQMVVGAAGQSPLAVGDVVRVVGEVREFYCLTQIEPSLVERRGQRTPAELPAPIEVTGDTVAARLAVETAEPYESVLVTLRDQEVVAVNPTYGDISLRSGAIIGDSKFHHGVRPPVLCRIASVTGFLNYSFGKYMVEPRGPEDIVFDPTSTCTAAAETEPSAE